MEFNTARASNPTECCPVESCCHRGILQEATQAAKLLHSIHRWDGYTVLCRKGKKWEQSVFPTSAITSTTLSDYVGAVDCYFSINTMAGERRNSANAKFLTSVWVDIDGVDKSAALNFLQVEQDLRKRQIAKTLPPFSFLVDSGRGVWAIILLRAEDGGPEIATPKSRDRQGQINLALASVLAGLRTDKGARDTARVTRIPSSLNSRTGKPVVYHPQPDASRQIPTSTLAELAAFFHLDRTTATVSLPQNTMQQSTKEVWTFDEHGKNPDPQRSEWGRKGQQIRFQKELAAMHKLEELRGGFRKYQRSNAVFVQSILLLALKHNETEIEAQALALGSRCRPPLEEKKCLVMAAVPHIAKYSQFPWTRRKILRELGVTLGELYQIPQWKPKQKRCPSNSEKGTGDRREFVLRTIQEHDPMSLSEMQAHLSAQRHFVSRETVSRDYAALGIVWKAKPGRRTAKNGKNSAHIPFSPTLGFRVDNSFSRGRKSSLLSRGSSPKGLGSLRPPHEIRKCPCGNNAADSISSAMRRTARA